jgi:imidazolonepropionase
MLIHQIDRLYTMDPALPGLGEQEGWSVALEGERVAWMGPAAQAPEADEVIDGRGTIGLPGLVDPHTHSLWAGSRADEFRRRLAGESYSAILEAGGGILSTVRATRSAPAEALRALGRSRLDRLLDRGITTVEIKSGYGLDPETEARLLAVARSLDGPQRVCATFLGAHAIPAEHRGQRDRYVRQIIEEQLPLCAPLAEAIDVYCDRGAFDLDESIAILEAGRAAGLSVKAHAEQVIHTGIAAAAARMGALSVDHLERIDEAGIAALAEHGTVAVMLPAAQLYLRDSAPPVEALREAGVPLALGTDLNPGSSPALDPFAVMTLGCVLQGLTVEEALLGFTRNAARALGRTELGWLGIGGPADLLLCSPAPGEALTAAGLVQSIGGARLELVICRGRIARRLVASRECR